MSSSTRSWRQIVLQADPDFLRDSLRPVVYEFSNGRQFRQRLYPYYRFLLTEDGQIMQTEDGKLMELEEG